MKAARISPTREHQLRALRQMRPRHPEWPADEQACLASEHISRLIFGLALNYARMRAAPAAPQAPATQAAQPLRMPKLHFDPRRAAANDHED